MGSAVVMSCAHGQVLGFDRPRESLAKPSIELRRDPDPVKHNQDGRVAGGLLCECDRLGPKRLVNTLRFLGSQLIDEMDRGRRGDVDLGQTNPHCWSGAGLGGSSGGNEERVDADREP